MPVSEIARRRELPAHFLEQLFATLRRGNLVVSRRGVKGGYQLARPAEEISVLEVVTSLDGRPGDDALSKLPPWNDLVDVISEQLGAITIRQVADREDATAGSMYYI